MNIKVNYVYKVAKKAFEKYEYYIGVPLLTLCHLIRETTMQLMMYFSNLV